MKFLYCVLIFLAALPKNSCCQKATDTTTKIITISNSSLVDCIITGDYVWVLDKNGSIKRLNANTYQFIDSFKYSKKIVAIGKSKTDTIYAADEDGGVFRIFNNRDTNFIWNTHQAIRDFIFTSDNRCFLITSKGIYDFNLTFRVFFENAFSNPFIWRFNQWNWSPSTIFIDSKDNIWLGFSGGEWGGDIVIFSTLDLNFQKFKDKYHSCYVRPIKSFFEIDTSVYATISLQHMRISSCIRKIDDQCSYIFESPAGDSSSENLFNNQEIYMGPGLYNSSDSSIYFYSQFGVFKGNIKKDLSKLQNWENILKTNFLWSYGMPDAVGYSMNVTKMFFEKNKLILLSPNNGVLISRDGKKMILLKTTYKPSN